MEGVRFKFTLLMKHLNLEPSALVLFAEFPLFQLPKQNYNSKQFTTNVVCTYILTF
jgi:hypothetical protein